MTEKRRSFIFGDFTCNRRASRDSSQRSRTWMTIPLTSKRAKWTWLLFRGTHFRPPRNVSVCHCFRYLQALRPHAVRTCDAQAPNRSFHVLKTSTRCFSLLHLKRLYYYSPGRIVSCFSGTGINGGQEKRAVSELKDG